MLRKDKGEHEHWVREEARRETEASRKGIIYSTCKRTRPTCKWVVIVATTMRRSLMAIADRMGSEKTVKKEVVRCGASSKLGGRPRPGKKCEAIAWCRTESCRWKARDWDVYSG